MAKIFLTDIDIEELANQGIASITLNDNTVLTDLAYEKARRLGIKIDNDTENHPPGAPVRPYLSAAIPEIPEPEDVPVKKEPEFKRLALKFGENPTEDEIRAAIIEAGRIMYAHGLMVSNDGNISARLPNGHILITPSGVCKGRISEEDLLVIDIDGNLIKPAGNPALKPTSEQPMHLEVYRQRPEINAIIHSHLIFANALAISQGKVRMDVIPEAAIAFGEIPITDFALPSSPQNAEAIRSMIKDHDVMLIRNHGSLTIGKDMDEALINLERLEHVSKTLTFAEIMGNVNSLPPDMLDAIAQVVSQSKTEK